MIDAIIQLIEERIRDLRETITGADATSPLDVYQRDYCNTIIDELSCILNRIRDLYFPGIEHDGKGVPSEISSITRLEVLYRSGERHGPTQALKAFAGAEAHMFYHTGSPWDIMAYKIYH